MDTLIAKDTLHDTVGIIFQNVVSDAVPSDNTIIEEDAMQGYSTDENRKKRRRTVD